MKLAIAATQLSLGTQSDDVARVQQAMQALGRTLPVDETERRLFGPGSVAVLKALQVDLGVVGASGVVDSTTVTAINAALAKLAIDKRTIRGRVIDADGNAANDLSLLLYLKASGDEKVIGKSALDADGGYAITYQVDPAVPRVDLRIEVRDPSGVVETTPPASSVLPAAGPLEIVDFVLSGATHQPGSEFERVAADVKPLLGSRDPAALKEDAAAHDASLLAVQTGRPAAQIAAFAIASRIAKETNVPAAVAYGLVRQGLPPDGSALRATHPDVLRAALAAAVAAGAIPATIDGAAAEKFLTALTPEVDPGLKRLLAATLNPAETDAFLGLYLASAGENDAFWKRIAADPALGNRADALKLTVQLASLTENHAPLVSAVMSRPDIKRAPDLARLTDADWRALVQTTGVPSGVPGADGDEQVRGYVQTILERVEAAYPTAFFAARLGASPIGAFLAANSAYDLKRSYPPLFFKQNPSAGQSLTPAQQAQLHAFQRIYRLTGRAQETIALAAKGVGSAQEISRLSPDDFARRHQDALAADRAADIHDRARRTTALALAVFGEHAAAMNRTAIQALPKLDAQKQADLAAQGSIPDWATLFGPVDSCACAECGSVHSAAAYFVDALHFLDDRGARAPLFARRPDLGDVELSCENTNTPLPLIDLVNEILEDAVAPPPPFTPFPLAPALETDLAQPVATAALAAAFQPPLTVGSRIEAVTPGSSWRVWDERFAYSIVKTGATLSVDGRSRQTSGPAAARRAMPQYRNGAAYDVLAGAVYPWTLPFSLAAEEARLLLTHLGVTRADLIARLRPRPDPYDPAAAVIVQIATERLGFSDFERQLLVGTAPQTFDNIWGSATIADLAAAPVLVDRTGLAFEELSAVLATRFVNGGATVTIVGDAADPDRCDLASFHVNGLSADVLSRLHSFVRLWRRLGWTVSDLDAALVAFVPDPNQPTLTDTTLVRLDHVQTLSSTLRLSVAQTLALWKPIDTTAPASLYATLFANPAVFTPQDDAFRLREDMTELADTSGHLADHAAALQAAFRLDAVSFAELLATTDGTLTLANLSALYRRATLARALRMTVHDLLTAMDLTGIDPFSAEHTERTIDFADVVTSVKSSGFEVPQLDYLLRHRFAASASFVPSESTLTRALSDLRDSVTNVQAVTPGDMQTLRQTAVIERVASAIDLPVDATTRLLVGDANGAGAVVHGTDLALGKLIAIVDVPASESPSRDNARDQVEILEKLFKIATVIRTLQLPASQIDWLFRENDWLRHAPGPVSPVPLVSWFSIVALDRLRRSLSMGDAAVEAALGALTAIAVAGTDQARQLAKQAFIDALAAWLGWPPADIAGLVGASDNLGDTGLLHAQLPDGYNVALLARLSAAFAVLRRIGAAAAQADAWCATAVDAAAAKAIRAAAKAKYDDATWQTIAVPLQDAVRGRQRDALVAYLVTHPAAWQPDLQTADADDLYAHFLIDVGMTACQLTSRIKQAIGSVQLFAQRCLMGLEPTVQTTDPAWGRWNAWMKNFRVWEANRKIWLYPENWIEPDLRDDKTPFFNELENELLQSDLDNDAAEQALMHYLEKLDEVARLEVAGTYQEDGGTVHVVARTFHVPRSYFYRRRDATLSWTPWEKLDLDVEGDHLLPVVWNGRLMVIWPIFTAKQVETTLKMPGPHENVDSAKRYWELQLAWSERQHGRWSGKKLSDPVTFDARLGDADILFGNAVAPPTRVMLAPVHTDPTQPPVQPPPDPPQPPPPGDTAPNGPSPSMPVRPGMISFKTFVAEDQLTVRGYLRLDYWSGGPGAGYAYPFGEFRFSGCRKIVTVAYARQMTAPGFALAPKGSVFDAMWFDGSATLTMLDGTFPSRSVVGPGTLFDNTNQPGPLPTDPSVITAARIDVPALGAAPAYRLLAPHQDRQFVGDRPFFFMDDRRAFVVSATGHSGFIVNPTTWAVGDLATIGIAARPVLDPPDPVAPPVNGRGLTVLVRGVDGTRIARTLTAVDLTAPPPTPRAISRFWSDRMYTFRTFHHPYVCEFVKNLDRHGIDALLALDTQRVSDANAFDAYLPTGHVDEERPVDDVDFNPAGSYAIYNWELFFHVPLLIATRLSANQRFADAQRWFHYVFNPTGAAGGAVPQRYWQTRPFYDRLASDYEQQSIASIEALAASGAPPELVVAVNRWRDNPFNPYAVARLRTTAFQKAVVMKYLDNLIAWGDQLFRGETIETISEATQLYVLAAGILGRRPETIAAAAHPQVHTFNSLAQIGLLGNALEQVELLIADAGDGNGADDDSIDVPKMLYFCVPANDKLAGYWDTVADRLFKIRHCMNIEGQVRQLPLFEPPIDPALLVRAQAAGLSLADVLSDIQVPLPPYRFSVVLQKANELASEVRAFGAELLAALEKRDSEALGSLRATQEVQLLQTMRDVRARQVDEATANVAAIEQSRAQAQARKDYYDSRDFMSGLEDAAMALSVAALSPLAVKLTAEAVAAIAHIIPMFKFGSPTTAGSEVGGDNKAKSSEAVARQQETAATVLNVSSLVANRLAEYSRRKDDWDFQARLAGIELKQVEQQLTAAQIRSAIAAGELDAHDRQIDQASAIADVLRDKFSNEGLYQWTIAQVSSLYFQAYQLAYDVAKRAERCLQHELGLAYGSTSYVRFGAWDSLKKGLLAGERLVYDLRRLEAAYLNRNRREYELTKHVSLVALAPEQLIALKETGACEFDVPEWLFDLDTPGHYRRRLKMVGVTIPCVIGPYSTIHCKVRLKKSSFRQTADLTGGYPRRAGDDPAGADTRFVDDRTVVEAMVTSTAQSDSGLFEPSVRDERYLPFEGAGAISSWRLELPSDLRTFDYGTITDVVLHLRLTSIDDDALRTAATASLKDVLADATARPLVRLFSLRHEFPTVWHSFVSAPAATMTSATFDLAAVRFPYFAQARAITIHSAKLLPAVKESAPPAMGITAGQSAPPLGSTDWNGDQSPGPWTIAAADASGLTDVLVVVAYTLSDAP